MLHEKQFPYTAIDCLWQTADSRFQPSPSTPLTGDIGYYLRVGDHNITPEN